MEVAGFVIGGLLVLAMIGVSVRGWLTLPSGTRIPVHHGIGGYNNYRSKTYGLVAWPVGGVVIYGLYCGISAGLVHPNHGSDGTGLLIIPAVLILVLASQIGAIRAASRGAGPSTGLG
jgi:hypothetical protein